MPRSLRRPAAAGFLAAALALAALTGCSKDRGSTTAFCDQVEKVPALESVLSRFSETDPAVLQDRIDKARAAYDDLAAAAPDEIEQATDDVVALVDEILTAVERHPTDPVKASDQVRDATAAHEDISTNRAKLSAYAQDTCGVQLDASLSSGASSTSSSSTTSTTGG